MKIEEENVFSTSKLHTLEEKSTVEKIRCLVFDI